MPDGNNERRRCNKKVLTVMLYCNIVLFQNRWEFALGQVKGVWPRVVVPIASILCDAGRSEGSTGWPKMHIGLSCLQL